jgi:hypothetical protein
MRRDCRPLVLRWRGQHIICADERKKKERKKKKRLAKRKSESGLSSSIYKNSVKKKRGLIKTEEISTLARVYNWARV